jgi:hypothetical protein
MTFFKWRFLMTLRFASSVASQPQHRRSCHSCRRSYSSHLTSSGAASTSVTPVMSLKTTPSVYLTTASFALSKLWPNYIILSKTYSVTQIWVVTVIASRYYNWQDLKIECFTTNVIRTLNLVVTPPPQPWELS